MKYYLNSRYLELYKIQQKQYNLNSCFPSYHEDRLNFKLTDYAHFKYLFFFNSHKKKYWKICDFGKCIFCSHYWLLGKVVLRLVGIFSPPKYKIQGMGGNTAKIPKEYALICSMARLTSHTIPLAMRRRGMWLLFAFRKTQKNMWLIKQSSQEIWGSLS